MAKPVYAWHFTNGDTLRKCDFLPAIGTTLKFYGKPILREQGLHASLHPFDALKYSPGDTLHLVKCGGKVVYGIDKLVCTERTIIASFEASEMLRYFARMQALSVLHLAPENMAEVVKDWIMTGEESIRSAAYSAANSAVNSAVNSAAYSAAYYAANSAANSVANSAAYYAANSAAYSDAYYAAYYAAYSAAKSAANSAAKESFVELVYECFEGPMFNINFKVN